MPSLYASPQRQASIAAAQAPLWSDYLKTVGIGTTDLIAAVPAGTRYAAELTDTEWGESIASSSQYLQDVVHGWGENLEAGLSDPAKERLMAEFGSEEFWKHPASSIALKATRTTPSMAATVASTMLTGGGAPAAAMLAGVSGGLSATQTVDEMYSSVDSMSNEQLELASPLYKQFRKDGLSEQEARKELNAVNIGAKPAILFAVGAATSLFGPEAQVARALGKKGLGDAFGGGILTRTGKAFGTSAASEAIETGSESIASEQGAVDVGFQKAIDPWRVASSTAEGALIGGLFGLPGGVRARSTTKADPRPEPINPPAAAVTNAVKPNQASVPARGSNTQSAPPIVPPTGKHTAPTATVTTVPGATPNQKKPKVAPGAPRRPAASAGTAADPVAPAPISPAGPPAPQSTIAPGVAPQVAPLAPQGDPTGLVVGQTEAVALPAKAAPTGQPAAPTPMGPLPPPPENAVGRSTNLTPPAPAAPTTPTPAPAAVDQAVPTISVPAGTATVSAPPAPQVPARTTAPGAGFGADTIAASTETVPIAPPRPSNLAPDTVAQPVGVPVQQVPPATQPAPVQEAAPALAPAPAPAPAAPVAPVHPSLQGVEPLKGKERKRNEKIYSDHAIAQKLLDARPTDKAIPTTPEEVETLRAELDTIVKSAVEQGADLRKQVGHPSTPHSLVWLREAQELVSYLNGKKPEFPDRLAAITRFVDREDRIRRGEGVGVKQERLDEANAKQKAAPTVEQAEMGAAAAKPVVGVEAPTVTKEVTLKGGRKVKLEVAETPEVKPAEETSAEDLSKVSEAIVKQTAAQKKIADIKAKEAAARAKGEAARAEVEARTAAANIEIVKKKAAEAAKPKPEPEPAKKIKAVKKKAADKKAAQEANLPAKVRERKPLTVKATPEAIAAAKAKAEAAKAPPKASAPAASSADFAAKVKEEVEPNPSNAQIEAGNASKAHVNIEGMPLAIETAANTDRHIVKPDGGRISRLYKHAYGHILGTKAPDGNPIDIFLGPEAYPNNPKLEGLPVVVIEQVDPDTKAYDEPKVMYGFKTVVDAVEAYDDSYPRGAERRGDIVTMTPNEFKQWRRSKEEVKNANETAGEPVSELDLLMEEQANDIDAERELDEASPSRTLESRRRKSSRFLRRTDAAHAINTGTAADELVKQAREEAAEDQNVAAATAVLSGRVSDFLEVGKSNIRKSILGKVARAIYPRFARRINELAGDVQIYVVPDEVFENELAMEENVEGLYDAVGDYIILKESQIHNDEEFAALILHEATHAAFTKAVYSNPKFRNQLEQILFEANMADSLSADTAHYGLTNIDELIAEAFSNQVFQQFLINTKASNGLIKELGLDGESRSLWDVLIEWMGKVLRIPKAHESLLGAVLRVSDRLSLEVPNLQGPGSDLVVSNFLNRSDDFNDSGLPRRALAFKTPKALTDILPAKVNELLGSTALTQQQAGDPKLLFLRTMDQIIQLARSFNKKLYEHLRKAGDAIERIRTSAERYFNETVPLIRKSLALERKYKGTGLWERFVDLVMEETRVQVYADRDIKTQTHLGKKTLRGAYPKAKWVELNAEWQALTNEAPDLMAFRSEAMNFYRDMQNKMSFGIIRNALKVAGFDDEFLAQRLFDETETEDDILALGKTYDHIRDASELAKVEVYFPQMRRGDQVVRALYKIIAPTNAFRALPDPETGELRTWEFAGKNARKQAMAYAAAQDHLTPTITSVWVDTNTGSRYFNEGTPDEVRVRPEDADAEQRFRVTVQNRFVEFFESKREAFNVAGELRANPLVDPDSVEDVVEKRYNPNNRQADLMSYQLRTLAGSLQSRPGFQALSDYGKNQLVQSLNVASLRMLSHTRIQSRRQPRTNVLGASRDFTRNMQEYSQSVAGYLGRLDHQEELNQAMKDARTEADRSGNYGKSHGASVIMNEMEKRVADASAFEKTGRLHEWMNRVLATSFASKLISPAYNLLNSLQVIMVTYPALAARYGPGRAAQMLFKVYGDIGVGQILKGGIVGSKRALIEGPSAVTPSIIEDALGRMKSPQERAMVNYIIERGGIDPDAGIEVSNMVETHTGALGGLDRVINSVSTFGRQMPKSIEAINRLVTAVASYRLEMQRNGGDHDAATVFAQETTNMTQGLYSHSNAAPVFNHPLGKMSFQFKKYGQMIYGMIGHNIGKAIRNAEPGDRAEAVKTLAYMAATHFVMAGALGLPQEPIKWLIMGASFAGAPITWADVENWEREILSSTLGTGLGEVAARGITRALPEGFGFDLSSRVGLQDLFTYGEPRSAEQQDISAFLWDTVGGAPASLVGDWIKGAQALSNGEWAEAAQRFSPIKVVTDAIKSYRVTSAGKRTKAGYESLSPYSIGEAALRTFGLTPSREAETNDARSYYFSAQQRASAARNDVMHRWANASPSERGKLWGSVERFNAGKAPDEKLTRSDLDKYAKRRRTEEESGLVQGGFRVTKRDKNLYKKVQGTYGYQ